MTQIQRHALPIIIALVIGWIATTAALLVWHHQATEDADYTRRIANLILAPCLSTLDSEKTSEICNQVLNVQP